MASPPGVWGRSSAGRALQWHCRGQGFDPPRLHHFPLCACATQYPPIAEPFLPGGRARPGDLPAPHCLQMLASAGSSRRAPRRIARICGGNGLGRSVVSRDLSKLKINNSLPTINSHISAAQAFGSVQKEPFSASGNPLSEYISAGLSRSDSPEGDLSAGSASSIFTLLKWRRKWLARVWTIISSILLRIR